MEPGPQFHGARRQIDDTHVRPPSVTGAHPASSLGFSSGSGRPPHTDLAFATHAEHSAWGYARTYAPSPQAAVNNDPDPKHRSRVYEVAPAADQYQASPGDEIESETGYKILREHHSERGATSTFHEINWNAFKDKSGRSVSSSDANHSYMETDPDRPPPKEHLIREAAGEYQNKHAVDPRLPGQLNLFSGKTVAEHKAYENTAGISQHLSPGQFENVAFHRDPTTSVIRASKDYHRVDAEFGTVH